MYMPEDSDDYIELCDVILMVQGQGLPVHSGVLGLQSRFFRKMMMDLKGKGSGVDGKLTITLDNSVSVEDAVLMLAFVYGKRTKLATCDEARRIVFIGDKYDIPLLLRVSGDKLCQLADSLHFIKPARQTDSSKDQDEWNNAARWLGVADRLNMQELKTLCQYVIVRDMGANAGNFRGNTEVDAALQSLDAVPSRNMGEICIAIMDLIYEGIFDRGTVRSMNWCKCKGTRSEMGSGSPSGVPSAPHYWGHYKDLESEPNYSHGSALWSICQRHGCVKGAICAALKRVRSGTQ